MSGLERPFLLTKLHEIQQRDGRLTSKNLEHLARSEKVPLAELYSFVKFFHYFRFSDEFEAVCDGPVCSLANASGKSHSLKESIPCPGLCDQPVAEYRKQQFRSIENGAGGYTLPPEVSKPEVIHQYSRLREPQRLKTYRSAGGYRQLERLLSEQMTDEFLNVLEASGLCGRGGAAFPVAAKLRAVRSQRTDPKYVVCNADEGEPATFKDRTILHLEPHLLLEGMAIIGHLVGASVGIIYLRYEYPDAFNELNQSIDEVRQAGLLRNSDFSFEIEVVRGAGSYVCGEETALLNSLEGRTPWPRERPPFPTENGLFGKPTAVSNVETISCIPPILEKGAEWFQSLGRGENAGTKIYSVSGAVMWPGNYELPMGVSARELITEHAGGPPDGRKVKAFTLGGISGGLLGGECLDLELDYSAPKAEGCFLGSGGVVVLDEDCCVVDFVHNCLQFYEAESCGKCYPCRIGTIRLREFLDGMTGRAAHSSEAGEEVERIQEVMENTSACGLGVSVPLLLNGLYRFFAEDVEEHIAGSCRAGVCLL